MVISSLDYDWFFPQFPVMQLDSDQILLSDVTRELHKLLLDVNRKKDPNSLLQSIIVVIYHQNYYIFSDCLLNCFYRLHLSTSFCSRLYCVLDLLFSFFKPPLGFTFISFCSSLTFLCSFLSLLSDYSALLCLAKYHVNSAFKAAI